MLNVQKFLSGPLTITRVVENQVRMVADLPDFRLGASVIARAENALHKVANFDLILR